MIDIAVLAGTVVSQFLAPVFRAGWDKVFDAASDQVGAQVAEETKGIVAKLWTRMRETFTGDAEKGVLDTFESHPEAAAPLLEALLREKLEADQGLAGELERLVTARPAGGTFDGAQVIGQTVNQLVIHGSVGGGAIVAGQIYGTPPTTSAPGPGTPPSTGDAADGRPGR
jgi:hypothetical protein